MSWSRKAGWHSLAVALLAMLTLSAPANGSAHGGRAAALRWLATDAKTKTVHLRLIASWHDANGGLNFNGYANGQMVVTVPLAWKVQVTFSNESAAQHSAEVVAYRLPVPEGNFKPAFKNAHSAHPEEGVDQTAKPQTFTFTASKAGTYMIVCAVPGHANGGMWDTLVVSRSAQTGTLAIRRR